MRDKNQPKDKGLKQENVLFNSKEDEKKDMYPKEVKSEKSLDDAKEEIKKTVDDINEQEEIKTEATEDKAPFKKIEKEHPFDTAKEEVTEEDVDKAFEKKRAEAKANNQEDGYKPIFEQLKVDCTRPGGKYYPHVRFLLSENDAKELWIRDDGFYLDNPVIARIDNTKPFILNNCEFKESENGDNIL